MNVTRCCLLCGRWGERGYRPADNGVEASVCTNDRACNRRRAASRPANADTGCTCGAVEVSAMAQHLVPCPLVPADADTREL
jgi:hypothetical protein